MKTTKSLFLAFALTLCSLAAHAAPVTLPQPEKEWTFLLFLNGHNNLSSYSDSNLKDMEKSGSTDKVNFVVEWGKAGVAANKRLLVQKSTNAAQVTSPVLMSKNNVDMGDYNNLVDFVKWGVTNFPAKHYFVAVWNHGSGWHFQDMLKINASQGFHMTDISFDDNSGNNITTEQLGLAMAQMKAFIGHNVDVYGSDACLMEMIEVANEMKDSVDYFAGSQETEPGDGWPYAPFFQKWAAAPTMVPAEVATLLSKEYLKAYTAGGVYSAQDVTFAALDMSKLDAVNKSTAALVTRLKSLSAASMAKVKTAAGASQAFYYDDYKDMGDFLNRIQSIQIESGANEIAQVKSDLASLIMTSDNSKAYPGATGLSIWIPSYASSYMDRYKGLQFDKLTGWSSIVTAITGGQ